MFSYTVIIGRSYINLQVWGVGLLSRLSGGLEMPETPRSTTDDSRDLKVFFLFLNLDVVLTNSTPGEIPYI